MLFRRTAVAAVMVLWLLRFAGAQGLDGLSEAESVGSQLPGNVLADSEYVRSVTQVQSIKKGIASGYPGDEGIGANASVLAAIDFEDESWSQTFRLYPNEGTIFSVGIDANIASFDTFHGRAIAIKISRGDHYGGSLEYVFSEHEHRPEPEAIYFRYYLRFGQDWDGHGGKLPGFGGTYDRAGWGGRPSDGFNGWSARGAFGSAPNGKVRIGTYCYHADMTGQYGSVWHWDRDNLGLLDKNRWYCIEQYLSLNSPKMPDGVIRAWVDGRLAFEKSDIRFRNTDKLKIEKIWFNVYHGGKDVASSDDHLFIDNIVIADRYIGPYSKVED